ncbi:MAG: DNA repair protein RecO [Candidatus Sumerlaeia bacterium]
MAQIETVALILDIREYRETSLLLTLLTREHGRLGCIAKGARRPKSDLAGYLQSFACLKIRLSVRESGGLATLITVVQTLHLPDYHQYAAGLERVAYAGLFAEILNNTEENDPHSVELFDLAGEFFSGLEKSDTPGSYALASLYYLLAMLGYAPDMSARIRPQIHDEGQAGSFSPHRQNASYSLDIVNGILSTDSSQRNDLQVKLTGSEVAVLAEILENQQSKQSFHCITVNRRQGRHLMRLAIRLFEYHLERRLKSARFVEEMVLKT